MIKIFLSKKIYIIKLWVAMHFIPFKFGITSKSISQLLKLPISHFKYKNGVIVSFLLEFAKILQLTYQKIQKIGKEKTNYRSLPN